MQDDIRIQQYHLLFRFTLTRMHFKWALPNVLFPSCLVAVTQHIILHSQFYTFAFSTFTQPFKALSIYRWYILYLNVYCVILHLYYLWYLNASCTLLSQLGKSEYSVNEVNYLTVNIIKPYEITISAVRV